MKKSGMLLRITTPTQVVLEREVTYVQAEDPSGRFGILPRHEPLLTALMPSILIYRYMEGDAEHEAYVALRNGVLRVTPDGVQVAAREAYLSDRLEEIQDRVRGERKRMGARGYRAARSLYQMQLGAWRRLMEFEDVRAR